MCAAGLGARPAEPFLQDGLLLGAGLTNTLAFVSLGGGEFSMGCPAAPPQTLEAR
jgi:hypothetical protein